MPTKSSTRSRADMEKAITDGGSVMLPDGRIVTNVADLPSETDLAAADDARLGAEEERLQKLVDTHTGELDKVKAKRATAAKAAPAPAADDDADGAKAKAAAHGHAKGHK
jgi:hypothetical protein